MKLTATTSTKIISKGILLACNPLYLIWTFFFILAILVPDLKASPRKTPESKVKKTIEYREVEFLKRYCIECHSAKKAKAGLDLSRFDSIDRILSEALLWDEILIKLGVIVPTSSDVSDIEVFFETILGYLETLDGGAIMNDELAAELAMEKPFVVPTSFVYLAKSFSLIEGICLQLDPDFDYFTYLEPMIQEQFLESLDISEIIMNTTEIPSKIGKINSTVLGLERSRAAMKRSMIKTRQEIRVVQYSVICALLAERFNGTPLAALLVGIAIWITFRKDRSL